MVPDKTFMACRPLLARRIGMYEVGMKDIPGFERYCVTEDGRIWSKPKRGGRSKYGKWLKPYTKSDGYLAVGLCTNDKRKHKPIHRWILETFVGPCPEGMECRHLDDNKKNNNLDNLRWGTRSENIMDSVRHGTHFIPNCKGERQGHAKLTEKQVRMIIYMWNTGLFKQGEIAKVYNIDQSHVSDIVNKKCWKHLWTQKGGETITKKLLSA